MIQGSCSNHPEYHVIRSLESSLLVSVFLPQYSQVGEYNLALKILEVLISDTESLIKEILILLWLLGLQSVLINPSNLAPKQEERCQGETSCPAYFDQVCRYLRKSFKPFKARWFLGWAASFPSIFDGYAFCYLHRYTSPQGKRFKELKASNQVSSYLAFYLL